jgi:CheY-like chemotaxis protein
MSTECARVLLADDDEAFLSTTCELLRQEKFACDCAREGQDAIERLKATLYDVVIVDLEMPGNRDLELLRAIKSESAAPPVIVVTGHPSLPTAMDSLRLSVVDYVLKPLDWPRFFDRVRLAVVRGRLRKAVHQAKLEVLSWAHLVGELEQRLTLDADSGDGEAKTDNVRRSLDQALGSFTLLVDNIKRLIGQPEPAGSVADPPGLSTCEFLRCPTRDAYETAVDEAIEVLEKTKGSFKSKELAWLRKNLEGVRKRSKP